METLIVPDRFQIPLAFHTFVFLPFLLRRMIQTTTFSFRTIRETVPVVLILFPTPGSLDVSSKFVREPPSSVGDAIKT